MFELTNNGILQQVSVGDNISNIIPTSTTGKNPCFMQLGITDNDNKGTLYISTENGLVKSDQVESEIRSVDVECNVNECNKLTVKFSNLQVRNSYGDDCAHISIRNNDDSDRFIYFVNYSVIGDDSSFGIFKNNNLKPIVYKKYSIKGCKINNKRQLYVHPHCILSHPNNLFEFYVSSLGCDFVQHYSFEKYKNRQVENNVNDESFIVDKEQGYLLHLESQIQLAPGKFMYLFHIFYQHAIGAVCSVFAFGCRVSKVHAIFLPCDVLCSIDARTKYI